MKTVFIHIAFLYAFIASAQKDDLKKLNAKLDNTLAASTGLHMEYKMVVKGSEGENEKDSTLVVLFKKPNGEYIMNMGNIQLFARIDKMMLKVNYADHLIVMEDDTTTVNDDKTLFNELAKLIDSAKTVAFSKEKNELIYTLSFSADYPYKRIVFKFSSKTHLPSSIYAEFTPGENQPFHSLSANYTLWDTKWKDKGDSFSLNRFVEFKNNHYEAVGEYKNYKVFKPETGLIDINFK